MSVTAASAANEEAPIEAQHSSPPCRLAPQRLRRRLRGAPALAVACAGLLAAEAAVGARPMATDDTGVAAAGSCQVEAWTDRVRGDRAVTAVPACGLTDEVEVDIGLGRLRVDGVAGSAAALTLKWVPTAAAVSTAVGDLRFGAAVVAAAARASGGGWRGDAVGFEALGSLAPRPDLNLYLNLYVLRERADSGRGTGARAAVAWSPSERWLLFVEALAAQGSKPVANAGLRHWLVPDRLGLDLVATRTPAGTGLSLGFGWYGLSWR